MRTIIIIGASGGIGNSVAETLLQAGYSVIGTYFHHPERVSNLEKIGHFQSYYVDLGSANSVRELQASVVAQQQSFYGLVNCAGIVKYEGEGLDQDLEIWHETVSVNLSGNYYLAKVFQECLSENGRFIMTSSTDSYFGGANTVSYAASKSGVNSLTKSLSLLLKEKKIRVNSVAPGWVVTPMIEANGDTFLEKVAEINPLKRNANSLDVALLIKFLLSEDAGYINGQVIGLDGGYTNQDPTILIEENV